MVEKYLKNMGEHRQNIILVPWIPSSGKFLRAVRKEDGTFEYDFSVSNASCLAEKYGVAERIGCLTWQVTVKAIQLTSSLLAFSTKKHKRTLPFPTTNGLNRRSKRYATN